MTKFYIVRHGQTDFNKALRIQGSLDNPLNETGKKQAKDTAERLKDVQFDAIYYSPLKRAKDTADEIVKYHKGVDYIEAPEIRERDFGDYEGVENNVQPSFFGVWDYNYEPKVKGKFETLAEIKGRIRPFLDVLIKKHPNQTICLVCHGGATLIIKEYFEGTPESKNLLDWWPIPNGEALIFEKS